MCLRHCFRVAFGVFCSRRFVLSWIKTAVLILSVVGVSNSALAASGTWGGGAGTGAWQTVGNWVFGRLPGATSGTTNPDTATFNGTGNITQIVPDAGRNPESITFDTAAPSYTIGTSNGNPLVLTSGGTIQIASTLFSGSHFTETIDAPLTLEGDYTLADNSANTGVLLDLGGTIESGIFGLQTLVVSGSGATTIAGAINDGVGTMALDMNGSGTLTLSGNNTFIGPTRVNAGALQLGDGTTNNGSVVGYILDNAALAFANPNAQSYARAISGTGSLTKSGAGRLTLSGNNTFTGTTTISAGTLQLGDGTTNNGSVASNITDNAALVFANPNAQNYAGAISGTGSLTKSGAGALTLGGNNTFSGGVTLSAGTVVIGNNNALGTGTLTAGGGTLQADGNGPYTLSDAVTLSNTLTVAGGNSFTLAGPISGSAGIVKTGAGTLTLSGTNSLSGAITVNAGTLQLANSTVLGTSTVVLNGGTLRASSALVATASLAGFGGTSTSVTGAGTGWTVNNTAITSNPINSNVLTLTDGAVFEARAAYSNTLQPIALGANGFNASYTYTPSSPNLATAADGVVFVLQNDARGLNAIGGLGGGFAYTSENGTPVQPSVAIALNIWAGHVIGTNLLTNGNPNNDTYLPVAPVNLVSGIPIDVSLAFNPIAQTITETLNEENTTNTFTHVYSAGDLAAAMGSDNVYVGFGGGTGYDVSTQTISKFSYTVTAPAVSVNNVVLNGGINSTIDVAATAAGPTVTIGTLSVGKGMGTALNVTATTAPMNQAYDLTIGVTTLAGDVAFNVANNGAGTGTLTLGAVSDGGSDSSITKTGAGTLTLSGTNSLGGATTVMGGTLNTAGSGTIGTGALTISTISGAVSAVNLGNSQTVSSLSGTLSGSVPTLGVAAGVMLTDSQSSGNTLFPGLLINSGAFIKSGNSSLELNGAPTLNANSVLQVNGGTLRFNIFIGGAATIGTGVTTTVSSGATLELAGSVSALSSGSNRVNITNNSGAAAGILVSGTHQHVGGIDGNGTTQVNAGSDLTADHIVQSALVIGGTAGSPALVMIDASGASGNPLDQSSGLVLADSLIPSGPFGAGDISSANSIGGTSGGADPEISLLGSSTVGGNASLVPEPSALVLMLVTLSSVVGEGIVRRRRAR
ncbi:MAG TPA: autotransporter-associated beta strand repeat-containing protein [Pirellulales bacterium]|jgi:autotransporter-associated beta strand protein|nr:autotransporter-associated beta strand repeat-containing protein [Pirellulales bacterium]